ncbi:MAG: hypothetical protein WCG04_00505 [Alphaproteobacteria bacterium]
MFSPLFNFMAEPFSNEDLKNQVDILVKEAKIGDPQISKIYWFPSPTEVRLVEVTENVLPSQSPVVEPFYFPPDRTCGMPALSGVALVHPSEERKGSLPADWGSWESATVIVP